MRLSSCRLRTPPVADGTSSAHGQRQPPKAGFTLPVLRTKDSLHTRFEARFFLGFRVAFRRCVGGWVLLTAASTLFSNRSGSFLFLFFVCCSRHVRAILPQTRLARHAAAARHRGPATSFRPSCAPSWRWDASGQCCGAPGPANVVDTPPFRGIQRRRRTGSRVSRSDPALLCARRFVRCLLRKKRRGTHCL